MGRWQRYWFAEGVRVLSRPMTNASYFVVLAALVGLAGCKSTCDEYCDAMYERGCKSTFLGSVSGCVTACENEEDAFEDMGCGSEHDDWVECSTEADECDPGAWGEGDCGSQRGALDACVTEHPQ